MTDWKHVRDWTRPRVSSLHKVYWNKISINPLHSEATWDTTIQICLECARRKLLFACEVNMVNGRRADVIIPELGLLIEVVDSESEYSIVSKGFDHGSCMVVVPAVSDVALNKVFGNL